MTASSGTAVLSIAGSDPSGGAGIQADLKTLTALGVYGAAAVSCLTVQNTMGVVAVQPVAPDLVRQQIEAVLADLPVSHIKIGMVGTAAVGRAIGEALAAFAGEVVYDPVLRATTGQALLPPADLAEIKQTVLARATILTPNREELAALTGCSGAADISAAGQILFAAFPRLRAVIVTGGDCRAEDDLVTDLLLLRPQGNALPRVRAAAHPRIRTSNGHGTGCTFASAFTAYHLLTGSDEAAFIRAAAIMERLLMASAGTRLGRGTGPLLHHLLCKDG